MKRNELNGLLGMSEPEWAVDIIFNRAEMDGVVFSDAVVDLDDFVPHDVYGFCILLMRGYMRLGYPHKYFLVDKKLVEILRERPIWKDLPDPTTEYQWGIPNRFYEVCSSCKERDAVRRKTDGVCLCQSCRKFLIAS